MAQSTVYRNALPSDTMLHEYRLQSVLGAGSFGVTYLGWDTHLEKHVAIKEYLPAELAMRASNGSVVPLTTAAEHDYKWGLERYILEARTLAKFSHANIVRVNRYFEANGTGYMVMDYERGEPLAALLKRAPRPDEAFLRRMLTPLLEGLRSVHAEGFLHRDIKPDNIFLRAEGAPVLIDFGAARQSVGDATKTLTAVLTPGYAPLEQYVSEGRQGPWTDLYALGGVLYRAITDESPPDAVSRLKQDHVGETLRQARGRYSEPFLRAVQWALEPEETKRPPSVEAWRRALFPAAGATGVATATRTVKVERPRPTGRASPAASPPGRRGRPWTRALALLLVAFAGLLLWHRHRSAHERAPQADATAVTHPAQTAQPPASAPAAPVAAAAPPVSERTPQDEGRPARPRSEVERVFRSADTNGDGYLSRREMQTRFPMLARAFERLDADHDGRVSLDEFLTLRRLQAERRRER